MMSQNIADLELNAPQNGNGSAYRMGMRIVGFFDDHINPIVVKELRQAVRSRFVMVLINLLLLVQLVIITGFLLGATGRNFSLGREVFSALHFLLLISSVMFVPAYVGIRFAAERSAQNVDLMFTTTISPLSIIWGKFLSGVVITALLFSTAAPFMVLTYMLRGIDVPTILIIMVIDFLTVIAAVQLALLLMSGSTGLVARGGMVMVCLFIFPYLIFGSGAMSVSLVYGYGGSWLTSSQFWLYATFFLIIDAAYHFALMLASSAVISPPAANRSFGIRLFLTAVWVVAGVACYVIAKMVGDMDWFEGWAMTSASVACLMLLVSICERDRWGMRVLAKVPVNPFKRTLAFLFYSGSAGGVLLSLLIIAGSMAMAIIFHPSSLDDVTYMLGVCFYMVAYAMTAVFIVRFLSGGLIKHEGTAAIALLLMAIGCLGPALLAFFVDPQGNWDNGILWRIGNPFGAMMGSQRDQPTFLLISGVWAAFMLAMCLPWMIGQLGAFRRPVMVEVTGEQALEQTLDVHDHARPLLDDPQVKADL